MKILKIIKLEDDLTKGRLLGFGVSVFDKNEVFIERHLVTFDKANNHFFLPSQLRQLANFIEDVSAENSNPDSRPTSDWILTNEKTGEVTVKMDNVKYSAPFPDRLIC